MKQKGGCLKVLLIILAIPVLIIGGFIFMATAELRRTDEEILKNYQPKPEIAEIAKENTLTDKGKATFYRAEPEIVDGETFRKYCFANGVEALGCNAPKPGGGPFGGRKIFLLKIDDPRFVDHKFSAAVHEMLHSAYDMLSSDEKKRINALLDEELVKHQADSSLTNPIETIKNRKINNSIKNVREELHSKFGVEYTDISPQLEDYYRQYFIDRTKVVELFKKGGFNSHITRMDELRTEMEKLAPQLTSMQNQLTAYQNAGDQAGFNSLIGQYNSMVSQYNAKAAEINRLFREVETFYKYFNPNYQPPEQKK